jgi:hypothetical protein
VQVFNFRTAHAIQTSSLWTLIAPSGNPSTDRHLRPSPMQCALTCEHVPLQHSPTPPSAGNSLFINLDSRSITPRFDYWMQVIKPSPGIDWMVHGRLSTSSSIWPEKGTRIVALLDRNCATLLYGRPRGGSLMIHVALRIMVQQNDARVGSMPPSSLDHFELRHPTRGVTFLTWQPTSSTFFIALSHLASFGPLSWTGMLCWPLSPLLPRAGTAGTVTGAATQRSLLQLEAHRANDQNLSVARAHLSVSIFSHFQRTMISYVVQWQVQAKPAWPPSACGSTRLCQREAYRTLSTTCGDNLT